MNADALVSDMSFAQGGPLRRLERLLRVTRDGHDLLWQRRTLGTLALVYVPVLVVGLAQYLFTGHWAGAVTRVYTHATALVSLPLLFISEVLADRRARMVFAYLVESGIVRREDQPWLRSIIESHARMRSARISEVIMLGVVIGTLATGEAGFARLSPASWWQAFVAAGVFRFLVLRWLWRWTLWGVLLFRVSRLELRLAPTHADRLGGLSPIKALSETPFVLFVAAVASAAAGGWADRLRIDPAAFASLPMEAAALGLAAIMLAMTPLLFFIPTLARTRRDGLRRYGALAHHHDRAFSARWIGGRGDPLGSPDMSSLADLGTGFERVEAMRPLVWSPRLLKLVLAGAWLPLTPLLLAHFGFVELLRRVIGVVV
jgi:hypothetical protein